VVLLSLLDEAELENVCTASAFPMVAPGREKTAAGVWQHLVFSLSDSQQYAAGSA
jgi:hypothetical protein